MPATVVVGCQWGDEGKGKVVDLLAGAADYVVRAQGGSNAGHTVRVGSEEYKFHLLPSGILRSNCECVIAPGVVVDPGILLEEMQSLRKRRPAHASITLSDRAHMVMPYHALFD